MHAGNPLEVINTGLSHSMSMRAKGAKVMTLEEEMLTIRERRHIVVTLLSNGHYGLFTSSYKPVCIALPGEIGKAIIRAHQDDVLERIGRPLSEVLVEAPPVPDRRPNLGQKAKVSKRGGAKGRGTTTQVLVTDPSQLGF